VQATTPPLAPRATAAVNLRRFYETQPYPCTGTELACLIEGRQAVVGDPERWFHLYFPDQPYREGLQVLVVGCRNLEAARLAAGAAHTNFLATDQDESALDQLDRLKQHFRLDNLELMWLGADQIPVIERQFDLVFCPQGPLPPLPPAEFLRLVRSRLTESGSVNLTVGGRHGRLGVMLFQRLLDAAAVDLDTADVSSVRRWVAALPQSHPFRAAVADLPELSSDGALIDVLRSDEPAFSVPELQALLEQSGLQLQRFLCQAPYVPQCSGVSSAADVDAGCGAGDDRWSFAVTELFRGNLRTHAAIACRDDVSFSGRKWLQYRPVRNPGLEIEAGHYPADGVARLSWAAHEDPAISLVVSEPQSRLFDLMDGVRSLAQIVEAALLRDIDSEELARSFFQELWRRDYVWFQIPAASAGYSPIENPL